MSAVARCVYERADGRGVVAQVRRYKPRRGGPQRIDAQRVGSFTDRQCGGRRRAIAAAKEFVREARRELGLER